jgi:hypothetical protein
LKVYHSHFALTINKGLSVFDYRLIFYYNAQVLINEGFYDAQDSSTAYSLHNGINGVDRLQL